MRHHIQLYAQPQRAKSYSILEICMMVEANLVAAKSKPEQKRMRQILKNNIEAQEGFAFRAEPHLKAGYLNVAKKLKKIRAKIPWQ